MVFAAILIGSTAIYGQWDLKKMQKLPVDSLNGRISFREEIRVVPPATKMELFSRALEWFKHDFPASTHCVILLQDQEKGVIIAKALIHHSFGPVDSRFPGSPDNRYLQHEYIEFTISLLVWEGGYTYVMTDFIPLNEKVGSQIAAHGFPPNPDNHPAEGVDSIRLKRIKVGDYNGVYGLIASAAENRITSLRSAMWE